MPEIQAGVQNDEDFGEFECASSFLPSSHPNPNPQSVEDDEWGDFVENPLQFHPSIPFSLPQSQTLPLSSDLFSNFQIPISNPPTNPPQSQLTHLSHSAIEKQWEKPRGAIPLSIFGDEEEEEEKPRSVEIAFGAAKYGFSSKQEFVDGFASKREVGAKNGFNLGLGVGFNDLILDLYGREEQIKSGDGLNSDLGDGGDDFDEGCWEFKDAFSENGGRDSDFGNEQKIFEFSGFEAKESTAKSENQVASGNGVLMENGSNLNSIYGNTKFDENGWELKDAFPKTGTVNGASEHKVGIGNGFVLENFNSIDETTSFDENGWEFKDAFPEGGTRDGSSDHKKEWKGADKSGPKTNVLTFDSEIQVGIGNGVLMEHRSNFNSTNPSTNLDENGWEFEDAFPEAEIVHHSSEHKVGIGNGVLMEHGSNFNSTNLNSNLNENAWGFEDAFPEAEIVHRSSEHKKEQKVADISGAERKVPAFDVETQGFEDMLENQQRTRPVPIFDGDKQDSGDMFDTQDGFLHKPTSFVRNGTSVINPGSTTAFSELISDLYSQAEQTSPGYVPKPVENGFSSAQLGMSSDIVNGDDDWNENGWEFKDAFSEVRTEDLNSGFDTVDTRKEFANDLKLKNSVDFYSRMKVESCLFVLHHLDGLKKAKKIAALSGEEAKVVALDEKIQATYEKLQEENAVSGKLYLEEHPLGNSCVHELLEAMQDQKFRAFELEYNLSKRISTAKEELSSAVALLEHATSTLHILNLASKEEQSTYTTTWSKMVSVCAQELQHGAKIWKQSFETNVHLQILSEPRGLRYFVSLGEIYRVAEILRASVTLYKPWILSNCGDSMGIFVLLEECKSAWMDFGLKEALESISNLVDLDYQGTIKALLESIDAIHELDALALQNLVLGQGEPICRLSLLSLLVSQDMKVAVWNGEHYFLKLANFWANLLSSDPPELPHIHVC